VLTAIFDGDEGAYGFRFVLPGTQTHELAHNIRHTREPAPYSLRAHPHQSETAQPVDHRILIPLYAAVIFGNSRSPDILRRGRASTC
jgi:hypothetical protein